MEILNYRVKMTGVSLNGTDKEPKGKVILEGEFWVSLFHGRERVSKVVLGVWDNTTLPEGKARISFFNPDGGRLTQEQLPQEVRRKLAQLIKEDLLNLVSLGGILMAELAEVN